MRLRIKVFAVALCVIGYVFLFNSLNTVNHNTKEYRSEEGTRTGSSCRLTSDKKSYDCVSNAESSTALSVFEGNKTERIVYNRVPKCGSRSILTLFKVLSVKNKFRVIEPASNYPYQLTQNDQKRISDLMSALRAPFLFHRHMHFINFTKFGGPPVVYINLIRDPLDRAVSHFYFRRFGDKVLNKTRSRRRITNQEMTYDECVLQKHKECLGNWGVFFIVPFFCGHEDKCRSPTNWALEQAKKNIAKYLVVGILEEFDDFIKVLEKLLPNFFYGAYKQSKTPDSFHPPKSVMSETRRKKKPSEEVMKIARKNMKLEYEFYDFIKERFHKLKRSLNIR